MSSERAREREVIRYYQTWLESTSGFNAHSHETAPDRFHLDGSVLRASNDKALIAFAQLGCLKLQAKRGIVTLIGTTRQYIIAEATKSLSLVSERTGDDEEDEIWFGNASIPRSQGVSEGALDPPNYIAIGSKGQQHSAPALVINDMTKDPHYSKFAVAGNGVTFYCGVPIISKSGYPIGVFTVSDDKPRDGLAPAELIFMNDMARIVMRHLETVKNDAARFRGERMILGLSSFMRGKSSPISSSRGISSQKPESGEEVIRPPIGTGDELTRQFKGMTITNADPSLLREVQISRDSVKSDPVPPRSHYPFDVAPLDLIKEPESTRHVVPESENDVEPTSPNESLSTPLLREPLPTGKPIQSRSDKMERVFSRAAKILRDCAAADGVVFFDASPVNVGSRNGISEFEARHNQSEDSSATSEESNSDSNDYSSSGPSTDSDGSMEGRSRILKAKGQKCSMLGYAMDISVQSTASTNTINTLGLTERSLRHFIRRYPRGKAFYFDADGDFSASDGSGSDRSQPKGVTLKPKDSPEAATDGKSNTHSSKAIAEELIRIVPGARNVIWLPLWDFSKQRWCAGMFLWSRRPDRLLMAQDDMGYLKTFGSSIMIEVSRIDAQAADEAKSTFIANISHELRSPLHGILGSVEFLQETALDAFQSSMALGVETCAKTLLDTVEHVLDYAKINQMSAKFAKRPGHRGSDPGASRSTLEDNVDLAALFEEAIEAVYAGSTFRGPENTTDVSPIAEPQVSANSTRQTTRNNVLRGASKFSGAVRIIIKVEKRDNWWVRTQPGAIRRVIMNILGNALKYTEKGTILISLSTTEEGSQDSSNMTVRITVKDTGRGMSVNFLRNHAFTPFSQESQFSVGTGLGLSIVRQIVNSLGGQIDLKSQKGVGTEIQTTMAFPVLLSPPASSGHESILSLVTQKTPGMRMCILDPNPEGQPSAEGDIPKESVEKSLRDLAATWFGMRTTKAKTMDGVTTDFFIYAEPPPIEYLLHHHGEHARDTEVPVIIMATNAFESASLSANGINRLSDLGRVLEIISQPCGPQKFAKAIHRCLTRLDSLTKDPESLSTTDAVTPQAADVINAEGLRDLHINDSYLNCVGLPQDRLEEQISPLGSFPGKLSPKLDALESTAIAVTAESATSQTPRPGVVKRMSSHSAKPADTSSGDVAKNRAPVLIVDDNEINLNLLVAFVKKAGHPYVKATDGLQAVQAYERACNDPKKAFKYILMDISMPMMDGIEATRIIRQHEKKAESQNRVTVITLTGLSVEVTRKEMMDAGADYFLSKPVKFKDLMELLHS